MTNAWSEAFSPGSVWKRRDHDGDIHKQHEVSMSEKIGSFFFRSKEENNVGEI